eukprot:scaffold2475_cov73-Skeletonema_menzelii.AAC.2
MKEILLPPVVATHPKQDLSQANVLPTETHSDNLQTCVVDQVVWYSGSTASRVVRGPGFESPPCHSISRLQRCPAWSAIWETLSLA